MSFILFGWAAVAGIFLFGDDTDPWMRPYLAGITGILILGGIAIEIVDRLKGNDD